MLHSEAIHARTHGKRPPDNPSQDPEWLRWRDSQNTLRETGTVAVKARKQKLLIGFLPLVCFMIKRIAVRGNVLAFEESILWPSGVWQ